MACTTISSRERWLARLALTVASLGGPGCIISAGGGDSEACGSQLSFSHVGAGDVCYCDEGYTWVSPDDEGDFTCERIPGKGSGEGACVEPFSLHIEGVCYCEGGYKWCAPDNSNDFTCCMDDAQDEAGGTNAIDTESGTDGGTGGGGATPDPADCTAQNEGISFCSNTQAEGPEGSVYWTCMTGEWVEMPEGGNEMCIFDGYEFAYGCVHTGTSVEFLCGNGPGTTCEHNMPSCVDDDTINYCQYGKLTQDSCLRICMEDGDDMGVTYDHGFCDTVENECFCCDMGDTDCPV